VLFVYSDYNYTRLDSGGGNLPKALSSPHPGVGTGFYFLVRGGERDTEGIKGNYQRFG
jgi:hypothetical protein